MGSRSRVGSWPEVGSGSEVGPTVWRHVVPHSFDTKSAPNHVDQFVDRVFACTNCHHRGRGPPSAHGAT